MKDKIQKIIDSELFERLVILLIMVNAIILGFDTIPQINEEAGTLFEITFWISQVFFLAEILLRLGVHAPRFGEFFKNFWNVFDFTIVIATFIPVIGPVALIGRILRVFRLLRVISVSDELRHFVEQGKGIFKHFWYTTIIAFIYFYVFAVIGHYLFWGIDVAHWGNLGRAMESLLLLLFCQDIKAVTGPILNANHLYFLYFFLFFALNFILLINLVSSAVVQRLRGGQE